jgi:hypothetical protein
MEPAVAQIQDRLLAAYAGMAMPPSVVLASARGATRVRSERGEAARVRMARRLAPEIQNLFERFERSCREVAGLVNTALKLDESLHFGTEFWKIAMVSMALQSENLKAVCQPFRDTWRSLRRSRARNLIWSDELEHRYEACVDRLEDLSETIALGLSDDVRGELERRLAGIEHLG